MNTKDPVAVVSSSPNVEGYNPNPRKKSIEEIICDLSAGRWDRAERELESAMLAVHSLSVAPENQDLSEALGSVAKELLKQFDRLREIRDGDA